MSEVILAVLQRPETASAVLRAAERCVALAESAHVTVLACQPSTGSAQNSLKAQFDAWIAACHALPVSAQWHEVTENSATVVEDRGRRADLIVIARPAEDDDKLVFRTVLFRSERPVLVVPPMMAANPDFGRLVAIAWREDGHTAKAMLPALRYVARAERVFLLAGVREGKATPSMPRVLEQRAVAAELHVMPIGLGVFGEALLAKAHELGADLLIMGAYAHGKLHDLMFGGVTRFMLGHADLPVLMRY
jgi:nucleotide-binding universal stress UspA family protein